MEYYDWDERPSRKSVETLFNTSVDQIPNVEMYKAATNALMNEGKLLLFLFF